MGGGCEGPNVFSLLDISSSMKKWVNRPAWATTQWATANHDGEDSRYHQVREALYTVLKGTSGVHFGFAQFPNIMRHGLSYSCSTIRVEDPDNPGTEIIEPCPDTRDGYCCSRGLDHELDWEEDDDANSCRGLEPNGDDDVDSLAFDDGTLYYNFLFPTDHGCGQRPRGPAISSPSTGPTTTACP